MTTDMEQRSHRSCTHVEKRNAHVRGLCRLRAAIRDVGFYYTFRWTALCCICSPALHTAAAVTHLHSSNCVHINVIPLHAFTFQLKFLVKIRQSD